MADDIEFDEFCDPNNPKKIKYDDILAAARRIAGTVIRTPCMKAHMSEKLGMDIYFKQEFRQYTGCFKERGVRNTLMTLSDEQKKYGAITSSTGNQAIALTYHAAMLGIPSLVVMPTGTSPFKQARCKSLGANIILHGTNISEAKRYAMGLRKEKRMFYINGYDHPLVCEGQGTIGIEIIEDLPTVDAILVPVGGGSLLAGVAVAAKHLKPDVEVYGIETDRTCSMVESLRKNERIFMAMEPTLADGMMVNLVGVNTFHTIKGLVDKMVVVKEDWLARAILHIVEEEKYVVEGAGACPVAAIMAGLFPNLKGKKVVCIISGGNIAMSVMSRAIERGMTLEGRLYHFSVTIPDRAGSLAELCSLLAGLGISIRDSVPEKSWVSGEIFNVELSVTAETNGWDSIKELIDQIKKHYKKYIFQDMADQNGQGPGARRGPCLAPNPVCMQK